MNQHVLGGAFLPHAPQFFTEPETEDQATIERVRAVGAEIGAKLAALKPDFWIVIGNDHAEQFFLHATPAFTLHMGGEASGSFAGRDFHYRVAGEDSLALIRYLQGESFDPAFTSTAGIDYALGIPMTHLGIDGPVIPIYVNAYVPPQPAMERCYGFGQALARGLAAIDRTAVVVASGGMSHFPGTDRYAGPDLEFDKTLLDRISGGNLRALLALDEKRLDETGNIELRCWGVAAGALGERVPDIVSLDPSWHHNYASVGFVTRPVEDNWTPHYPSVRPDRVALTSALHVLAHDATARERYLADGAAYAAEIGLEGEEAAALADLSEQTMTELGVHPLVPFLTRMLIDHERRRKP
jgi:2,3-dihydroxyphenylpropionate 1,2-dioxygenase